MKTLLKDSGSLKARSLRGPSPPLFWVMKEKMTEGRKASRASKLPPPPPFPVSTRSGSATGRHYLFTIAQFQTTLDKSAINVGS